MKRLLITTYILCFLTGCVGGYHIPNENSIYKLPPKNVKTAEVEVSQRGALKAYAKVCSKGSNKWEYLNEKVLLNHESDYGIMSATKNLPADEFIAMYFTITKSSREWCSIAIGVKLRSNTKYKVNLGSCAVSFREVLPNNKTVRANIPLVNNYLGCQGLTRPEKEFYLVNHQKKLCKTTIKKINKNRKKSASTTQKIASLLLITNTLSNDEEESVCKEISTGVTVPESNNISKQQFLKYKI